MILSIKSLYRQYLFPYRFTPLSISNSAKKKLNSLSTFPEISFECPPRGQLPLGTFNIPRLNQKDLSDRKSMPAAGQAAMRK